MLDLRPKVVNGEIEFSDEFFARNDTFRSDGRSALLSAATVKKRPDRGFPRSVSSSWKPLQRTR